MFTEWIAGIFKASSGLAHPFQRHKPKEEPGPHPPVNHTECSTSLLFFFFNLGKKRRKTNSQQDQCLNGRWKGGGGKGEVGSSFAQMIKNPLAMRETWVRPLGREDAWRRAWQPTPVLLPGESHGLRSLVGYSPLGHKESDVTK